LNRGIQTKLARHLSVTDALISLILKGERPISNEMAKRLAELFPETTPGFWIDADLATIKRIFDQWNPRPEIK
jgi:plasmid maintenance system antidote protein VapI